MRSIDWYQKFLISCLAARYSTVFVLRRLKCPLSHPKMIPKMMQRNCLVCGSLWNVNIACGMLLLLVECYDSLWNVTIACGMLLSKFNVRDATCSLRSHWLARCARTGLFLRKMHENLMKIFGDLGNLTKCKKINENLMKI